MFTEVTTSSGDNNIEKKWGGKYDTVMVPLLLILFYAAVLVLLIFSDTVCKLLSLTQGLVKIFSKVTALLGNNKIKNERGSKYDTSMLLFLLLLDASVLLLLLVAASSMH